MNIPKAYTSGFIKAARSPRMLLILYITNLCTALILALAFMGLLKNSFDSSKLFESSLRDFDFTAFSNFTFYSSSGITTILGNVIWLVLAYFLISVFLTGGIIRTLNRDKFTTSNFFAGAAYNFFRFLGLSAIVLLFQIIVLLLVYVPVGYLFNSFGQNQSSELNYYYVGIGGFVLHLLLFLMVSMIGDYGKFHLVVNDSFNIFKGFWKGVKYVFGHFLKTYFLYLFLLFIPAVVMYFYLYYESDFKMATGVGILIVFGIQQAFILLRVFLRVWVLASQFKMYADDIAPSLTNQNVLFSVVDTKKGNVEKIIDEKGQTSTGTLEESEATGYAIDFDKTFAPDNELEEDTKVLTEDEMLQKVQKEQLDTETAVAGPQNVEVTTKTESLAENTEPESLDEIVEPEELDENAEPESLDEITEAGVEENAIDKTVNLEEQNKIIEEKKEKGQEISLDENNAKELMLKEIQKEQALNNEASHNDEENAVDVDDDEHHDLELERVEQNVIDSNSELENKEENKKKPDDDMIEFEL